MTKVNKNFENLVPNYLFADVAKKANSFIKANPDKKVIKLGIGDVTLPLAPVVVDAMKKGCDELGVKETFKGYPDYEGYEFLRQAIADYYKGFGVEVAADEVLVNEKDIVNRNKNVDKTVKEWLKPYQKILSDHDYNEFSEMIFSVVSMAEQTGFENGVRFAVKMLYSLLND